jgi:hypothetical protein
VKKKVENPDAAAIAIVENDESCRTERAEKVPEVVKKVRK